MWIVGWRQQSALTRRIDTYPGTCMFGFQETLSIHIFS